MKPTDSDHLCADRPRSRKDFRVIIVGGSIAGLTLAHSLRKYKIDYCVLEAYHDIAPQVGASIGLAPSGCGILDQLGIFDAIVKEIEPLRLSQYWTASGRKIAEDIAPSVLQERNGYPLSFLDRQKVLAILYDHLAEDQSKVFLNKRVVRVEDVPGGVVVHCKDGSQWTGDVAVGADGVHSTIRNEIWNRLDKQQLGHDMVREKKEMISEYSCIFGISADMKELEPGHIHRTYGKGFTTVIMVGKNHRTFWFLFAKMDRKYTMKDLPRFTAEDREKHVAQYFDVHVSPEVTFKDLYKKGIYKTYVPLEEAFFEYWIADRLVCIGDSVHKMTPNTGQGGNCAIESAASLANCLKRFIDMPDPCYHMEDLRAALSAWSRARQPRARKLCRSANYMTRVEAWSKVIHRLVICYVLPYISRLLIDGSCLTMVGSEILEYLPRGEASRGCPMPPDAGYRRLQQEPFLKRFLRSTPLGLCFVGACCMLKLKTDNAYDVLEVSVTRLQKLPFLTDLGLLYGTWLLESYRRSHSSAAILLPMLMAFGSQSFGIGTAVPLYFLLDYLQSPLEQILVSNYASVRLPAAKTLLPALLLGYYLPLWAGFSPLLPADRRMASLMWSSFGVLVPSLQFPLAAISSTTPAKEKRPDMSYIRWTIMMLVGISGISFQYARLHVPAIPLSDLGFLQYDQLFAMLSCMIWTFLSFHDLQVYGVQISLLKVSAVLAGATVLGGPGVAFAVGWQWREEYIASISG